MTAPMAKAKNQTGGTNGGVAREWGTRPDSKHPIQAEYPTCWACTWHLVDGSEWRVKFIHLMCEQHGDPKLRRKRQRVEDFMCSACLAWFPISSRWSGSDRCLGCERNRFIAEQQMERLHGDADGVSQVLA